MDLRRHTNFLLAGAIMLLLQCSTGAGSTGIKPGEPITDRASDGLLQNPVLQRVVDLQASRDAVGLRDYFSHSDPLVRARAAFAAASVQSPDLQPYLIDLLSDPDARVRADAAFALGQMGDSAPASILQDALRRESEMIARSRTIEAIGKIATQESLNELIAFPPPQSERETALAIARAGSRGVQATRAVEWAARHLTSPNMDVRMNAALYFGITPTSRPWALHAAYVRDALADYSYDELAAMHLVRGLGRFHGADGALLLSWLEHGVDWRVRTNTAMALAPMSSDRRVLDALMHALDDSNVHVAAAAAGSLGWSEILDDGDMDRIERWIPMHPDAFSVQVALLAVLANHDRGDVVLDHVRQTIKDNSAQLVGLLPAVALVQSPAAFAMLSGLVQSTDADVSENAVAALVTRWTLWRGNVDGSDRIFEALAAALTQRNPNTVVFAAAALTDPEFNVFGSNEVLAAAYDRLSAQDVPRAVSLLRTLGGSKNPQLVRVIQRGGLHEHPMVRRATAEALAQLTGRTITPEDWFTAPRPTLDWQRLAGLGASPTLHLETTRGTIVIELLTEQAPYAVQTIAHRVETGQYNNTPFHRVLPNFIVQGGRNQGDESADPYAAHGLTEYTRLPFGTGVVGLANEGKDTEGSEFFITHSMQPQLDGSYTSIGYVIEGMDVVNKLQPLDRIITATLIPDVKTS